MPAAGESGSIAAIVTWHNDRLHHSPRVKLERETDRFHALVGLDFALGWKV